MHVPNGMLIHFIIRTFSQEIIAYYLPDDLRTRLSELLDSNNEGELTSEEQVAS